MGIASLLRLQKADLASSVRNFFETRDRFKKPNFFLLELPYRNIFSGITRFYFAIFELHLGYLHKVPEFIIKYLNSPEGLSELRKNAKQAVNQASINQKDVKNVIIRLPSWDEQDKIVCILKNLQNQEEQAKEAAEAVLTQIDTMKKAILARAFRGELGTNDPVEEWAGELLKER